LKNGSVDVGRVILISDGRPTEGERCSDILVKHAEELRLMGVTLSTLGVGLDYNEDLMQSLALGGGGRYHYLRRSHQLPAIVDAELRHASRIVARSVQLRIPAQLEGFDVVAVNGHATEASGTLEVRVGDIAADEVRNILLRLDVKPVEAAASSALQFAAPEVLYTVAADGRPALLAQRADRFRMAFADDVHTVDQHRAPSVRAQVLRMSTAQHLTSSMRAFAKGDVTQATQALSTRVKALNAVADETGDLGLRREAENVGRVLRRLEKAEPQSESGLELVKEQKARAFGLLY
jgi:Ca-activated chloride channel family protein